MCSLFLPLRAGGRKRQAARRNRKDEGERERESKEAQAEWELVNRRPSRLFRDQRGIEADGSGSGGRR